MRKLITTAIVGMSAAVAVAGCGNSTQPSASAQCEHLKTAAQTWAQNYVSDLPTQPTQAAMQQLVASTYKLNATSHGLVCN